MRKATVYIAYAKWPNDSLVTLAGRTSAFMRDNVYFPDPHLDMDEYALLTNDYREKQEIVSNGGGRLDKEARDNAKVVLTKAMKELAFYVNSVADGNREILASSGFEFVPERQPVRTPRIPPNVRLLDGPVSGEIRLVFGALHEAWEYEYCYTTHLDENGTLVWGDLRRTTDSRLNYIGGLTPGERVYVRVRARNRKGAGDWSEPVSLIAR